MTRIFDHSEISHLQSHGLRGSGRRFIWIWARSGSRIRFRIGRYRLDPTHGTLPGDLYTWERAGAVNLGAGANKVSMASDVGDANDLVGAVAVSSSERFEPSAAFEKTRIYSQMPSPLPDTRMVRARNLHAPWTLRTYPTLAQWKTRAEHIREHILACLGLLPLPERTPLRSRVFGRIEREGYSVEKAVFESFPGFYVCGNLYRPLGKRKPGSAILCPHGHWKDGRLENSDIGSIAARCINFALQGHVAYSYDKAG